MHYIAFVNALISCLSHTTICWSIFIYILYIATQCFGSDPSQFPSSNLFAAAGDGIWDNGASCGRQYLVRCISASLPGTCVQGQTIQIRIIDYIGTAPSLPSVNGSTIVLSRTAFQTIANSSVVTSINIEFQQVWWYGKWLGLIRVHLPHGMKIVARERRIIRWIKW